MNLFKNCIKLFYKEEVTNAFRSIGSNILLDFGKEYEYTLPNGKKRKEREKTIWIGNASWRISKNNQFIIGSGDKAEKIDRELQRFLGLEFKKYAGTSQFMDIEFYFSQDYILSTFFNWKADNQWTLLTKDDDEFSIDCEENDQIFEAMECSKQNPPIKYFSLFPNKYQLDIIQNIEYDEYDLPSFIFENKHSIKFESCTFRIEKNGEYQYGYLDDDDHSRRFYLSQLVGKKLKKIEVNKPMMDARFTFEEGLILRTFTCTNYPHQWSIQSPEKTLFIAKIQNQ